MNDLFSNLSPAGAAFAMLIGGALVVTLLKLVWGMAQWGRKTPFRVGSQMSNARAYVDEWDGDEGWVTVAGERWRATAKHTLSPGDDVTVVKAHGLTVEVKKKN